MQWSGGVHLFSLSDPLIAVTIKYFAERAELPRMASSEEVMNQRFSHSVTTMLPRDRVWELLTEIENWPKFSEVYTDVKWSGLPWVPGSCVVGHIQYPVRLPFRYVLEKCERPATISYLAHSSESGFATHRTIHLEANPGHTVIRIIAYAVGKPSFAIEGGPLGFLKTLSERWFQDFASFCDDHVLAVDRQAI